jgi:nicotinamide riboside transporter PnuC
VEKVQILAQSVAVSRRISVLLFVVIRVQIEITGPLEKDMRHTTTAEPYAILAWKRSLQATFH